METPEAPSRKTVDTMLRKVATTIEEMNEHLRSYLVYDRPFLLLFTQLNQLESYRSECDFSISSGVQINAIFDSLPPVLVNKLKMKTQNRINNKPYLTLAMTKVL